MNWRFIGMARLNVELYLRRLNPWTLVVCLIWLLGAALLIAVLSMRMGTAGSADVRPAPSDIPTAEGTNPSHVIAGPSATRNLERFMNTLGDPKHSEQQVQSLFAIAKGLQLGLPQGSYRFNCDSDSEVCRYRIQLPVRGSYVRIRSFLDELLMAIPFASIDDLTFKREAISDEDIDVRVSLSLYTRNQVNMVAGSKESER
jgi:hypothetical protein